MATTNTTTTSATTKQRTAGKTAAKKSTAGRAPAKKATTSGTRQTTGAGGPTGSRKTTGAGGPVGRPPLREREARAVVEDAGYALAGLTVQAVELAKRLPARLRAEDGGEDVPARVRGAVEDLRGRLGTDVDRWLERVERGFDDRARAGREATAALRSDERVRRVLDQTSGTRTQVKAAVTSVLRTADVAVAAGREQAETAGPQVKGAVTSIRRSAATVADAVADAADDVTDATDDDRSQAG